MTDRAAERIAMVERQLVARGIDDPRVLAAMRDVPREAFIAGELAEFAYEDTPLPIEAAQTISQPYVVAVMTAALELGPESRALEVGTGSGYAAAILSRVAGEVYTIERHAELAEAATRRLRDLGYTNVHVRHGDGTLGWPEHAPYDGIVVAAGGPDVPEPLLAQLAIGGRLVIPIGPTPREQQLVRVRRVGEHDYRREVLGSVRFVPLIGAAGWHEPTATPPVARPVPPVPAGLAALVRETAEPLADLESDSLDALVDRIGDARVVLLGEATHGTSEFYRFRARLTQELVLRRGFTMVAVEADWPDAARVDHWVRHLAGAPAPVTPFTRFPTWMWRNREVAELVAWLREHNGDVAPEHRVGFHGLDLYSLYTSIATVLCYLDDVDPDAARVARARYACLTPWQGDPAAYGRAVLTQGYRACEPQVVAMLRDLLDQRLAYQLHDGERFLDALQNARVVADAERYYRAMYYGSRESWNLRDQHMFETLQLLLAYRRGAKAIVWEHNSHVGNAAATEMGARGELNVGQLARETFGEGAYLVGFGTDHGTVAAASDWDGPMEVKRVRPAHPDSYERVCHESRVAAFTLALRHPRRDAVKSELAEPRLERAIGVIYRPETELASHYFQAVLPAQFDEYVWFDETHAVTPLDATAGQGMPETYPFGL